MVGTSFARISVRQTLGRKTDSPVWETSQEPALSLQMVIESRPSRTTTIGEQYTFVDSRPGVYKDTHLMTHFCHLYIPKRLKI